MAIVPLGKVIRGSKSSSILGIANRDVIIEYIERARELALYRANWDTWMANLDLCSNNCGYVTLPYFVDTVMACNVGGFPSRFRNQWYQFSISGAGSRCGGGSFNGSLAGGAGWTACGFSWDDDAWSPVFQDIKEWSYLAAICEDPVDGDGSKQLIVQGVTVDAQYNEKSVLTIPPTGPSSPGARLTLLTGYAATDPAVTPFKSVTQVTKPVTRGYVKLIAFPSRQAASAVTLGYYAPHETNPLYRRIRVNAKCAWVRVRYKRAALPLVNDYDECGFGSYEALLQLIRAIRLRETGNYAEAEISENKGVQILTDLQTQQEGPGFMPVQFDPSDFVGSVNFW